jgi:DNA polymerase elongation subunit (family B)
MASARPDPESDDLHFMCKDFLARDSFRASDDDSDERSESSGERVPRSKLSNRHYQILMFGNTEAGTPVTLEVNNFKPFFYVRIPDVLARSATAHRNLRTWLLHGVPVDACELTACEVETHKTLFDYNAGSLATFMKVTVPSIALWRSLRDRLLTKSTTTPIEYESRSLFGAAAVPALRTCEHGNDVESLSPDGSRIKLKVYEANIDPVLRFFHIQDISPASWIRLPAGDWTYSSSRDAKTDIVASCEADDVVAGNGGMAPFLIGSWDIECNSSHGDFPLAAKTYRKPVREMYEGDVPTSIDELCVALADAMNGKGSLSPIFLKRAPTAP